MVARPSGSLVSLTWASDSTQEQHFLLHELGIDAGHGVVLEAAFASLGVAAAVADGYGNHRRNSCSAIRLSSTVKSRAVGSVGANDERRDAAGHVLLWDIDGTLGGCKGRDGWW